MTPSQVGNPSHPEKRSSPAPRRQFSVRGLLLLITLIAISHPLWIDWYETLAIRTTLVPTNYNAFPKISPFTSFAIEDGRAHVKVNDTPYELRAINGVKIERLIRVAALAFDRSRAEKRLAEDLPAVLNAAGITPQGNAVDLELFDPQAGARVVLTDVPMTSENRFKIYRSRHSPRYISRRQSP